MRVQPFCESFIATVCLLGIAYAVLPPAAAQSVSPSSGTFTEQLMVDFTVAYNEGVSYVGPGTIAPFGNANMQGSGATSLNATFTFTSGAYGFLVGDSFQANGPASLGGGDGCTLAMSITGGTGVFANSSGSMNLTYACSQDIPKTGSIRIHGTGSITLTIEVDESCQANPSGPVQVDCQNQSVSIDPLILGTPFELHYQSERVAGRIGTSSYLKAFAGDLGGWTLDARHGYDPLSRSLYLGGGGRRRGSMLGSPPMVNGNYLITDESGREVYVFDTRGRHLRTQQALTGALVYQFGYDTNGRLTTITDVSGDVTTIQRDGKGNPTAFLGPYGQKTTLGVNADGYITQITNPNQESINLTYGTAAGLVTSMADALGNVDTFQYDSQGLLTRATHAGGASEDLTRVVSDSPPSINMTTAAGVSTNYATDLSTRGTEARTVTYASGLQARVKSSPDLLSTKSSNGVTVDTSFIPDPRWGIQTPVAATSVITTPGGSQLKSTLTRAVTLKNSSDPFSVASILDTLTANDRQSTTTYNGTTRALSTVSPAGRQQTATLDASGRVVQNQFGGIEPINYSYNSKSRLAGVTIGSGISAQATSFTYNAQGYLASITDAVQRVFSFNYDAAGRITKQVLPQGASIVFEYNANGKTTSVTPPGRGAHALTYTPSSLLATYTPPSISGVNAQTAFAYNPDGKLARMMRGGDQIADIAYDNSGRPVTLTQASGTVSYSYDSATGNPAGVSGPGNLGLSFSYDGSLLTQETWTGPVSGTVANTFDNNFFVTTRTINNSVATSYQYDPDGYLIQAGTLNVTRGPQSGLVTGTVIDNLYVTIGYDSFGRASSYLATANGSDIYGVQYVRDALGRISQKTETIQGSAHTYAYSYDAGGQLSTVTTDGAVSGSYFYDDNGNRLSFTGANGVVAGAYDAQDRLNSYGTTSYTYRDDGQLLARMPASEGVTQYQSDAVGNLLGVSLSDGTQLNYLIDGRGRRVSKSLNGAVVSSWLYQNSFRPVAELDGSNNIVSVFVYIDPAGTPAYMLKNGSAYQIISDERGSPRLVVDTLAGQVIQRLDYDEFGQVLQDTNPGFQPFGFAGGQYDPDTKLVLLGDRSYDSVTGRWTAKDPILFAGGDTNLYSYVLNDPVNLTDPSGLGCKESVKEAEAKVEEWAKGWLEKWATSKLCFGPICASPKAPEISVGGSAEATVGGTTVVSVSGEAAVGITSTSDLTKPFFYITGKVGAKVPLLAKIPFIGKLFSRDLIEVHQEFGKVENYNGMDTQLRAANRCTIDECH